MRYLGLDLGSKTLGIAISDKTNTISSIYTTIFFDRIGIEIIYIMAIILQSYLR